MRFLIVFSILLASCGRKMHLHVMFNEPYCGGAPPTNEQFFGEDFPYADQSLLMMVFTSEKDSVQKLIALDENGKWSGKIKNYTKIDFYRPEQLLSIEEIKAFFFLGTNRFYELLPDETIGLWKSRPLFSVPRPSGSEVEFTVPKKCYTGLNPCYRYTGPRNN